jgi:Ala-tRNA(Pro) deacylase
MSNEAALELAVEPFRSAGVPFELIPHRRTESALAEARALHLDPGVVAKTVVLRAGSQFIRAVIPADGRVSFLRLTDVLGTRDVHIARETALAEAYPEFELGAVPPCDGAHHGRLLVDRRLAERAAIVFEAGTHDRSIRLKPVDLISASGAWVVDIAEDRSMRSRTIEEGSRCSYAT